MESYAWGRSSRGRCGIYRAGSHSRCLDSGSFFLHKQFQNRSTLTDLFYLWAGDVRLLHSFLLEEGFEYASGCDGVEVLFFLFFGNPGVGEFFLGGEAGEAFGLEMNGDIDMGS